VKDVSYQRHSSTKIELWAVSAKTATPAQAPVALVSLQSNPTRSPYPDDLPLGSRIPARPHADRLEP